MSNVKQKRTKQNIKQALSMLVVFSQTLKWVKYKVSKSQLSIRKYTSNFTCNIYVNFSVVIV